MLAWIWSRVSLPYLLWRRRSDLPRFPGSHFIQRAAFLDPGGLVTSRHNEITIAAFRFRNRVGSHKETLSRLNRAARRLAVYASQARLPLHHARLATGLLTRL